MGYMHIENFYKNHRDILLFKELYALEKLHGTSAHIGFLSTPLIGMPEHAVSMGTPEQHRLYWDDNGQVELFSGGASINVFEKMISVSALSEVLTRMGITRVAIHGELYGGSQQKQVHRYGPTLKFCAFDVRVNDTWLCVPDAEKFVQELGLEFVSWVKINGTVEACDLARDAFSVQAKRNGITEPQYMEGVVLRPLTEFVDHRGNRVVSKHKRPEERETATVRTPSADSLKVLSEATAIAQEWVTETRLDHVLDKLPQGIGIDKTGVVLKAMIEDVLREGAGEIVDSKEARAAISAKARMLFHARLAQVPTSD